MTKAYDIWQNDPAFRQFAFNEMQMAEAPFFIYHLPHLKERIEKLKGLPISLYYATKANPHPEILKVMRESGVSIDVASVGELEAALNAGFSPAQIISTGPAKSASYIENFLKKGVRFFVLESELQLSTLESLLDKCDLKAQALLRLQLEGDSDDSSLNVLGGSQITPFGHTPEEWTAILNKHPSISARLTICGLHNFQWGNICQGDILSHHWKNFLKHGQTFAHRHQISLQYLDLGGGLGISYQTNGQDLSFADLKNQIEQLGVDRSTKIIMEIGRYLAGPIGYYFNRLIDRKIVRGQDILVFEGGINHLMRPVLAAESFPNELVRTSNAPKTKYVMHGPLCTGLDCLGKTQLPSDIKPGDWVVFFQTGAYGATEAMPNFLLHPHAQEIIFSGTQ